MAVDSGVSPGEVGGWLAGAVVLLGAFGKGIAWLLNWRDARAQTRAAKLQAWHEELARRETALDAKVDERMAGLEQQVAELGRNVDKWRMAFHLVAAELLQRHPQSTALMQAQKILAEACPMHLSDIIIPPDMERTLSRLDDVTTA